MTLKASTTIWLSDKYGTRIKPITDSIDLTYTRAVNEVTPLTLTIPITVEYRALFADPSQWKDYRIEIWRRLGDGAEYLDTETIWFVRDVKKRISSNTLIITAYCANEILKRRIIAYRAGTENAEKTDQIDDLMKAYVRENLGANATDTNRIYDEFITIAGNLSQGVSITKAASFNNLLDTLQDLAQQSNVQGTTPVPIFFDVVGVTTASGVTNLDFRTYKDQRGLDRTYDSQLYAITLSDETKTLDNVEITYAFADEANYIYVGGSGEESNRVVQEVDDAERIADSPINRRERFQAYTNSNDTNVLDSEGYKVLRASRGKKIVTAQIRNTDDFVYGRDWFFGDKLTVDVDDEVFDVHIAAVTVKVQGNRETIQAALQAEL